MEGKMESKRRGGRKSMGMMDVLIENERYGDIMAVDRQGWRIWLPGTCGIAQH